MHNTNTNTNESGDTGAAQQPAAPLQAPTKPSAAPAATTAATTGAPTRDGRSWSVGVNRNSLLIGLGAGVAATALVLAFTGYVWPGFAAGPGAPNSAATQAVTALGSKDASQLDQVSCRGPNGTPTAMLPPQAMQLIQTIKISGPTHLVLDTQALAPVDLTLGAAGKTQTIPADVVLGVNDRQWCLSGFAPRQQ
jgi:hypothetical protein